MSENLLQAAGRHLQDAKILLENERFDNTAYISTYSIECILKLIMNHYTETDLAKSYNHNLIKLSEATTTKLLILYPQINNTVSISEDDLQRLTVGHPERRYWANDYIAPDEARQCFVVAQNLYQQTVSNLVLDGHISLSEV